MVAASSGGVTASPRAVDTFSRPEYGSPVGGLMALSREEIAREKEAKRIRDG